MLMPSRWDWRMRAYMSTVSILGSFQAEQLRSRSSACGAGYGGSILRADLTGGGGSLLRADYHTWPARHATMPIGAHEVHGWLLRLTLRRRFVGPLNDKDVHAIP